MPHPQTTVVMSAIMVTIKCAHAGVGWGDPHYDTCDGRRSDFNGQGEFVLLEVLPTSGEMFPVFTLQGRMEHSMWPATTHRGLAFGWPELAFHVSVVQPLYVEYDKVYSERLSF